MAVHNVDENREEARTLTMPYGGGVKPANPNLHSPSVHELAVQQVEAAFGPTARDNPNFEANVKDVEDQLLATIKHTQGM